MMMIVGLCGFIGSGKDAAAEALVAHGFKRFSFAQSLKDAVAAVFGWDREMLEGSTEESRAWRETIDAWWAERLDIPCLTPRWVLQHFGLVMRDHFHGDVWTASLEKRLAEVTGDVVISDAADVQIWANKLALIHAKYLAQAILDNPKYAREACAVGKGAHNWSPLLGDRQLPPTFPPSHFKIWRLKQYNFFFKWLGGKVGGKGLASSFPASDTARPWGFG